MRWLKSDLFVVLLVIACLVVGCVDFVFTDENSLIDDELSITWLLEPTLYLGGTFHSGFAWIQKENKGPWSLIDKAGNVIVSDFQARYFSIFQSGGITSSDLTDFLIYKNHKFGHGYANFSGDVVIPPIYQEANLAAEGLAAVKQGNFWGVVDHTGAVSIPFVYEGLTFFRQGVIRAKKDGKWGYIDARGQTVIDFVFDEIHRDDYPEGLYPVVVNGKEGLMDKERNWVLEPIYEEIYPSTEDLFGVQKDGKVGFADHKGRIVIDFQYRGVPFTAPEAGQIPLLYHIFSEGLAVVRLSEPDTNPKVPSFGVINKKGELLFKLPGWPRGHYKEGFLLVNRYRDKRMGLMDKAGKWHSLPSNIQDTSYEVVSNGILRVSTSDKKSNNLGYLKIEMKK
jgi:hypothetical protein